MARPLPLAVLSALALLGCQPQLPPSTASAPTQMTAPVGATSSLRGGVQWPDGPSIAKVRVMVPGRDEPVEVVATDMEGRFSVNLTGVGPGKLVKVFALHPDGRTLGTVAFTQPARGVLQSEDVQLTPASTIALYALNRLIEVARQVGVWDSPERSGELYAGFQRLNEAALPANRDPNQGRAAFQLFAWTGQPGEAAPRLSREIAQNLPAFGGAFETVAAELQQSLQKAIDEAKLTLPPGADLPLTFGDLKVGGLKPPGDKVPVTPNNTSSPSTPSSPNTGSSNSGSSGDNGVDSDDDGDHTSGSANSSGPVTVTGNLEVPTQAQ